MKQHLPPQEKAKGAALRGYTPLYNVVPPRRVQYRRIKPGG